MKFFFFLFATTLLATSLASAQGISHPKARDAVKRHPRVKAPPVAAPNEAASTVTYERSVRDIFYIPRIGDYLILGRYAYDLQSADYTLNGVRAAQMNKSGGQLTTSLVGAITDSLSFHFDLIYGDSATETKGTNSSSTFGRRGFYSPALGAYLVLMEQSAYRPVDTVFHLQYTPKLGTSRSATAQQEGNNTAPADSILMQLMVLHRNLDWQWAGVFSYQPSSSGKSEDPTTDDDASVTLPSILALEGRVQKHILKDWFALGSLGYVSYGSADSSTYNSQNTVASYMAVELQVGAKWMLNPRSIYVSGTFGYAWIPNHDIVSSGVPMQMTNHTSNRLQVEIGHSF